MLQTAHNDVAEAVAEELSCALTESFAVQFQLCHGRLERRQLTVQRINGRQVRQYARI